jgi:AraC family transcriptional regulator
MNVKDKSRQEYIARINRVMDYIEKHLTEDITLDKLAQIACFSPFHFNRIFSTLTNETITAFIQRKRIEKAARLLKNEENMSISEIAFDCGFGSAAHFCRTFRKCLGMTAKQFRETEKAIYIKDGVYFSKNGQPARKISQLSPDSNEQLCSDNFKQFNHSNSLVSTKLFV